MQDSYDEPKIEKARLREGAAAPTRPDHGIISMALLFSVLKARWRHSLHAIIKIIYL